MPKSGLIPRSPMPQSYIFKVSVDHDPSFARTIAFDGNHSLGDVQQTLERELGLSSGKTAVYFMSGELGDEATALVVDPERQSPAWAGMLGSLSLEAGHCIAHLHDPDVCQTHTLELVEVTSTQGKAAAPRVVARVGEHVAPLAEGARERPAFDDALVAAVQTELDASGHLFEQQGGCGCGEGGDRACGDGGCEGDCACGGDGGCGDDCACAHGDEAATRAGGAATSAARAEVASGADDDEDAGDDDDEDDDEDDDDEDDEDDDASVSMPYDLTESLATANGALAACHATSDLDALGEVAGGDLVGWILDLARDAAASNRGADAVALFDAASKLGVDMPWPDLAMSLADEGELALAEAALSRLPTDLRGPKADAMALGRAVVDLYAGREKPAEAALRALVTKRWLAGETRDLAQGALHSILLATGRKAEAKRLLAASARRDPASVTVRNAAATPGPNDPCACGSGKKHKKCCGAA